MSKEQAHHAKNQPDAKANCQRVTQHCYRPRPLAKLLLLLLAADC
jgi:hypothetical protein